ncbi:MAG: hypothetical protein OQK51_02280 [Kangiellaceae bacterium]|nr:hypothetical protein [Kangiellaceae bacterium]
MKEQAALQNTLPHQIQIDKENNLATLTFVGHIGIKQFADSFSELIRHKDFVQNMNACYRLENAYVDLNINDTEILFHFAAGMRDKRGDQYQLAFVYKDEMTKMLVEFYRLFLVRTDIEVLTTPSIQEAQSWLIHSHEPTVEQL